MKNNRSLFFWILAVLLVFSLSGTASATTGKVTKELEYRNIKVSLDGVVLDLKDAAGNHVEPFMFDGTNYLPVRALAEALGLNVAWDGKTSTVVLSSPTEPRNVAPTTPENTIGITGKFQREIEYRNIRVTLDGKMLNLKDSAGNSVEPFMMGGSNYLPVRALAESLGLQVSWDGLNNVVVLTAQKSITTPLSGIESAQAEVSSTFSGKSGVQRVTSKTGSASASDKLYVAIKYGEPYKRNDFQSLLTEAVEKIVSIAEANDVNVFFIEVELSIEGNTNIYWHSYNSTSSVENSKTGDLFDVKNDVSYSEVLYSDVSQKLANSKPIVSTDTPSNRTVYITKTGKRYHYNSNCNGGTYYSSTLAQARARGLTPCNKCVK